MSGSHRQIPVNDYVVTSMGDAPAYCTTLEGAMKRAEQMAHIDAGPADP